MKCSNTVDQCMYTNFEYTEGFGMETPKKFFGLLQYLRKLDRQVNILPTGAQCHLLVFQSVPPHKICNWKNPSCHSEVYFKIFSLLCERGVILGLQNGNFFSFSTKKGYLKRTIPTKTFKLKDTSVLIILVDSKNFGPSVAAMTGKQIKLVKLLHFTL